MLFFFTFYESENPKIYHRSPQKIWSKFPTLIINQRIRIISEGSCDTEDWSNDAENSALITEIHFILKYIKIENCYLKLQ